MGLIGQPKRNENGKGVKIRTLVGGKLGEPEAAPWKDGRNVAGLEGRHRARRQTTNISPLCVGSHDSSDAQNGETGLQVAGCGLEVANRRLQAADRMFQAAGWKLQAASCKRQTANCKLQAAGC